MNTILELGTSYSGLITKDWSTSTWTKASVSAKQGTGSVWLGQSSGTSRGIARVHSPRSRSLTVVHLVTNSSWASSDHESRSGDTCQLSCHPRVRHLESFSISGGPLTPGGSTMPLVLHIYGCCSRFASLKQSCVSAQWFSTVRGFGWGSQITSQFWREFWKEFYQQLGGLDISVSVLWLPPGNQRSD